MALDVPFPYGPIPKHFQVCPGHDGKLHSNLVCPIANISSLPLGSLPDIQSKDRALEMLEHYSHSNYSRQDIPLFLAVGFHKPHIPLKYPAKFKDLYPLSRVKLAPNRDLPTGFPPVAYETWTDVRGRDDVMALDVPFPYGPIPKHFQLKIRQSYYAAISYVDSLIGEILAKLDKLGMAQNTIISFVGDHGWQLGEHAEWAKYSNFETAVRVPLMFYTPGVTNTNSKPGHTFPYIDPHEIKNTVRTEKLVPRRSSSLVELVDIFPTLSDLAGLPEVKQCPVPSNKVTLCTEGHSMASLIYNTTGITPPEFPPTNIQRWKNATFSQYPRPSLVPGNSSDLPRLAEIQYMGYSMRTYGYRYTEWVRYNHTAWRGEFTQVVARELYIHQGKPPNKGANTGTTRGNITRKLYIHQMGRPRESTAQEIYQESTWNNPALQKASDTLGAGVPFHLAGDPLDTHNNEYLAWESDSGENHNVASDPAYRDLVKDAAFNLHRGWPHALPVYVTEGSL